MRQMGDAVPAGAGAEDFLVLPVPESPRGAAALREETGMFAGPVTREKDRSRNRCTPSGVHGLCAEATGKAAPCRPPQRARREGGRALPGTG
jgi:hypothetical protein